MHHCWWQSIMSKSQETERGVSDIGKESAMEYQNLLELIKTVSESNITGFHYENGDTKIIISTVESGLAGVNASGTAPVNGSMPAAGGEVAQGDSNVSPVMQTAATEEVATDATTVAVTGKATGNIVKSPLVGTFYTAPSEEAAPFVSVGDHVKVGQTLAIVEAMKLMNDIESEFEGTITQVLVKNGDCVEYGQPLFAIG